MRHTIAVALACLAGLVAVDGARAQESVDIYLKSKKGQPEKSVQIAEESVKGIRVKGKGDVYPAEDIEDVDYTAWFPLSNPAATESRKDYGAALAAEKEAAKLSGDKQADQFSKAIAYYGDMLKKVPKELLYPRQQAEYKIGYLYAQLGFGGKLNYRLDAIKALDDFKKKNPDSWQYTRAMLLLLRLHADEGDFDKVRATVKEITDSQVAPKVKGDVKILLVRLLMDAGDALIEKKSIDQGKKKYAEAKTEAEGLLAQLPKDSPGRLHAVLYLAQCDAVIGDAKQKDKAIADLNGLLKQTAEKDLKAAVYNQLGELYYKDGRLQDARWQFLWVDVVYNQDKEQHARALYYLWKIFSQLNETERGQEFFETLTAGTRFAGTYYHGKALKESKETQ